MTPASAAATLRTALEATADALARPDLDRLLDAEAALTSAFAGLSLLRSLDAASLAPVREDLLASRAALDRSVRLGSALNAFIRISFAARGQGATYDPASAAATELAGRGFRQHA